MPTTRVAARAQLVSMSAASVFPKLPDPDIDRLLDSARRPDFFGRIDEDIPSPDGFPRNPAPYGIWAAETAYAEGDARVPIDRNGSVYVVTVAGTSGTLEPSWPVDLGATVTDGTVTWQQTIADVWQPTYDLNAAAAEAWRLKAGLASGKFGFSSGSEQYNPQQMFDHCMKMAEYYAKKVFVAVPMSSPWTSQELNRLPRA